MALIPCPACNKQISEAAISCPKCGHPIQNQLAAQQIQKVQRSGIHRANTVLLVIGAMLVLPFVGGASGWGGIITVLILALFPAVAAYNRGESFINWYCYGVIIWIVAMIHSLLIKSSKKTQ